MSVVYPVKATCLRYVVPFKYKGDFEGAVNKVDEQKVWVRKVAKLGGSESDLYKYVKGEFLFDETGGTSTKKSGYEWIYYRSDESDKKDGKKIAKISYVPGGAADKLLDIYINNVGLYLFRNGFGFAWYELGISAKNLESDILKKLQNEIREINRHYVTLWRETTERPRFGYISGGVEGYLRYTEPFSFGHWINELFGFLDIEYFAIRKSAYRNMIKSAMSDIKKKGYEVVEEDIENATWDEVAPDKAILFSYAALGQVEDDNLENHELLSYHIANGYSESYHMSRYLSADMKHPFENVVWYATSEGVAYLAWPQKDNVEVFNSTMVNKFKTDYFTLFIKILYQSYSLLMYAEKIQNEISAVHSNDVDDDNITSLYEEINRFLTKSMATSVSFVQHQSDFYIYIKKQLHVKEDVESINAGLNTLNSILSEQRMLRQWTEEKERDKKEQEAAKEEEKRDNKLQTGIGLLSILAICSALVDSYDFISKFSIIQSESFIERGLPTKIVLVIAIIGIVWFSFTALRESGLKIKDYFVPKKWKKSNNKDSNNIISNEQKE
jgi:hypothetical protein